MGDQAAEAAVQTGELAAVIHLQLLHLKDNQAQLEDHVIDRVEAEEQPILLKQLQIHQDQVLQEDTVAMEQLHTLIQAHVSGQMDQLQEDGLLEEDKAHLLQHQMLEVDEAEEVDGRLLAHHEVVLPVHKKQVKQTPEEEVKLNLLVDLEL